MNEIERIQALIAGEKPDRVPIYPFAQGGFSTNHSGLSIAEAFNNPEASIKAQLKSAEEYGWMAMPMIGYAALGGWEFGGEIKWPSGDFGQAPSVLRHVVDTPDDALKLELPDVPKTGIIPLMLKGAEISLRQRFDHQPFRLVSNNSGPFNFASNIVGMNRFARWMLKRPDAANHLLRLATEFLVGLATEVKNRFGAEDALIWGGEPATSNQLISPKLFEKYALPHIKEAQERILGLGFKHFFRHICGDQIKNMPYWSQIPMGSPGFVSIGHEVKLEDAAEYFPNDVIVGNIEPALVLTSTPEAVYDNCVELLKIGMKLPGGFILGMGCEMAPRSPKENVMAITRAVNDHGYY